MLGEIETVPQSLPSSRNEQLQEVWVPLCQGSSPNQAKTNLINGRLMKKTGLFQYYKGQHKEALKLLSREKLLEKLRVQIPLMPKFS